MLYYSLVDLEKCIPASRDNIYHAIKAFDKVNEKYNLKGDIRFAQGFVYYKKMLRTNNEKSKAFAKNYYGFLESLMLHLMTLAYDKGVAQCSGDWVDSRKQEYGLQKKRRMVNEFYFNLQFMVS